MTTRPSILFQPRHRGALFARLKQNAPVAQPNIDNAIVMREGAVACHGVHFYYVAKAGALRQSLAVAEHDLP